MYDTDAITEHKPNSQLQVRNFGANLPTDREQLDELANESVAQFYESIGSEPESIQDNVADSDDRPNKQTRTDTDSTKSDDSQTETTPAYLIDPLRFKDEQAGMVFVETDREYIEPFDSYAPTKVHRELFAIGTEPCQSVVHALRELAIGESVLSFREALEATELDNILNGHFTFVATEYVKGNTHADSVFELVSQLGGKTSIDLSSETDDIMRFTELFTLTDVTPTIRVPVGSEFREARQEHRKQTLSYLLELSRGVRVELVGTEYDRRLLNNKYGDMLPSNVTKNCNQRQGVISFSEIQSEVGFDSLGVHILETIQATESGIIDYGALQSAISQYDRTTLSRWLNERLIELELVNKYGVRGSYRFELTQFGQEYLEYVDESKMVLSDYVTEPPKLRNNNRVSTTASREGGKEELRTDRHRLPSYHENHYLNSWETLAAIATSKTADITICNYDVRQKDDRGSGGIGYNLDCNTLVVSVEYDNVMQHMTTFVSALLDWRVFNAILTERLSDLDDLLNTEPGREYLRQAPNCGYLSDDITSGQAYGDRLKQERTELLELTKLLSGVEGDKHRQLRSEITKKAKGLAGTVIHLLDFLDVNVVWEIRVPEFTRRISDDQANQIARTIAHQLSIQSEYNRHVPYRLLFEDRENKRQQALTPTIDTTNPYGNLLTNVVVVGDFGDRINGFREILESHVSRPADLHDDAPEIAVKTTVATRADRATYSEIVRLMCEHKELMFTRKAVSLFEAFARTPYDVAEAFDVLARETEPDKIGREIRIGEVRRALASLPADRLLSRDATPGVRAMTKALLETNQLLTRSELADRAGVSTQTVRNHIDVLLGSGIATETDGKIRFAIAFNTDGERQSDRVPLFMHDDLTFPRDIVFEVFEHLDELTDDVIEVWIQSGTPDVMQLCESYQWLEWLVPVLDSLTSHRENTDRELNRMVMFGAECSQLVTEHPKFD